MHSQAVAIQARTAKLLAGLHAIHPAVDPGERAQKLFAAVLKACKDMDVGYRHTCASASPEEFVSRISHVARHARKTRASLMMLTQLGYVPIESARDLIFEARGLANIFTASRATAKSRQRTRLASQRRPAPKSV